MLLSYSQKQNNTYRKLHKNAQSNLAVYLLQYFNMPEAVYPLIAIAVIFTVQGFTPSKASSRLLTQIQSPETRKSLKLQQILTQDIGQNEFQGSWISSNNQQPLKFFDGTKGTAEMAIYAWAVDDKNGQLIADSFGTLAIRLLDPSYHNKKVIYMVIKLMGFQNVQKVNHWQGTQGIKVFTFNDHTKINNISVNANFSLVQLKTLTIQAQSLNLSITLGPLKQYKQLPFLMLVPTILMLVFIQFAKRAEIPPQKLSLITISIIINFLMYISLLEFYRGIQLQKWLIINGVLTFAVVVRFTQTFQPAIRPINTIRGYMTFYCLSLVYFIGLFNYYYSQLFIILQGLWLVPQIIHNIIIGLRPGFYPSYLAMILVNQLYIIYFKGYSDNIFKQSPEPFLCILIVLLDILQILILYGQHIYGVRFFIPKRLRKNYHNYIKSLDVTSIQLDEDCAICLLPLKLQQPQDTQVMVQMESMIQFSQPGKKIQIMETPCGHKFHVICLNHWMQHKMQCPLDKKVLPPVQ